ncbi:ATP:cob(I)alamin adenosyltransferase [Ruficoccus amylovorans]|uniref:Corrinoid adenosyltransferase n=1 Tax=Ruficoccus amylovorans TaxID=1804625 RepID=A0A842HB77_9BACT|nr:ATP:cob(I)alamin adenosyltransferase [Ruficoccus amylovorans]MBC2593723.1 ATP:cob(I)alamin adenosyltransferase [Ruficoccus amylovorans]
MSLPNIATRRGDSGTTALWSGERVSKTDARIRTTGEIDLVLAMLGRGHRYLRAGDAFAQQLSTDFLHLQRRFTYLMGEVSTGEEGKQKYTERKEAITQADVEFIEGIYERLRTHLDESGYQFDFSSWKVSGETGEASAEFHVIRAAFRRVELMLWALHEQGFTIREPLLKCFNRFSDVLFYTAVLLEE